MRAHTRTHTPHTHTHHTHTLTTHTHTHHTPTHHTHTHSHTTQERSVQAEAGGLLGEVRRKLSDVQHCLKLVTILKELREHKRETHRKSGGLLTLPLLLYFTCYMSGVLPLLLYFTCGIHVVYM